MMLKLPYLGELYHTTLSATFDMCTAGNLVDRKSQKPIQKGMTVMSTSIRLTQWLMTQRCPGNHDHQVIEGSVSVQGKTINRSEYTAAYPRKFARQVAKLLRGAHCTRDPVWWSPEYALVGVGEPLAKRRRLTTLARPKNAPSQEITAETPAKRQKLHGKQAVDSVLTRWNRVFDQVDRVLPRVGKVEVLNQEIIQEVQQLWNDKKVKYIMACRGSNRTIAPPERCTKGEAPYRKRIYIQRGTTKILRKINGRIGHPCLNGN